MMPDYFIMTIVFLVITGPIGVIVNLAFITLTLRKPELRKEYAWFLSGVSAVDLIYCMNNCVPQLIAIILDVNPKGTYCQIVGVVLLTNGVGAVCIQPLLAMNRYVALYYAHLSPKIFNRRNNAFMMMGTYLICFAVSIATVLMGDMGRMGNTVCGPQIEDMSIPHVCLFVAPILVSYGICIFCGYKILHLIKSHQATARRQALGSRLQDAKEIFRLILLELIVPISLEMPVLVFCLLSGQIYIPHIVIAFTVGLFITHPVLDPIIVVIVMKPYRLYAKKVWRSFCGLSPVVPVTGTTIPSLGRKY